MGVEKRCSQCGNEREDTKDRLFDGRKVTLCGACHSGLKRRKNSWHS